MQHNQKDLIDAASSIKATKASFEAMFSENKFYNRQTQDETHLKMILEHIPMDEVHELLDLGTGSGYLAFALAKQSPKVTVTGLDIVETTLKENAKRAENMGIHNLIFCSYDGIRFPFQDASFDVVTARYCLHHFPKIQEAFSEVARVIRTGGTFFLSDPTPNEEDTTRFVDAYMQMKKDGHIKFYTLEEWTELGQEAGLKLVDRFQTSIRFPKKKSGAKEFPEILKHHAKSIIDSYEIEETEEEIMITEKVWNLRFQKC